MIWKVARLCQLKFQLYNRGNLLDLYQNHELLVRLKKKNKERKKNKSVFANNLFVFISTFVL